MVFDPVRVKDGATYEKPLQFSQGIVRVWVNGVQVHDGWLYFIHGWTAVIEEVFDIRFTASDIAELARIAGEIRTGGAAA